MRTRSGSDGFTLIELLIVVAIIGILAAIAIPNFLEAQTRAKVARAKADLRNIHTAIETYRIDDVDYPPDWNEVGSRAWPTGGDGYVEGIPERIPGLDRAYMSFLTLGYITTPVAYMSSIPDDPFWAGASYSYDQVDTAFDGSRVQNWLLASMGPDRIVGDWHSGIHPDTFQATSLWYDGSNGTVSEGDIIRTPDYISEHVVDY